MDSASAAWSAASSSRGFSDSAVTLAADSNQALGIGTFACEFMRNGMGTPADEVLHRTTLFFTDSVLCGLSALALRTRAPTVLRDEALQYSLRRAMRRV